MSLKRDSLTTSPWQETAQLNNQLASNAGKNFDVIIIGAGITGVTTALMLQKSGKKCAIVDSGNIGFGTTGGTTAHLNTFLDSTYPEIESNFSKDAAKLVAEASKQSIALVSSMLKEHQIDCDFETKVGYLFSEDDKEDKELNEIFEASIAAGVAVEKADTNNLPIAFIQSLRFQGQAQFHPLKYLLGLANAFLDLGGSIYENTFIEEVKQEGDRCFAKSDNQTFEGDYVVYATHLPPGINKFSFRCAPYRSYVLGVRLAIEEQYPTDLAYDMKDPYHYFRTHVVNGEKIMILGGADHKTGHGEPQDSFEELKQYVEEKFEVRDIPYEWSSQYYIPVDGLPYIGKMNKDEDRVMVATGYNGNGMIWGTFAGQLLSDLILQRNNPLAELLDPSRMKPIAGFTEFVKENADVAYRFVADRFKAEEIESLREIGREEGKVIEYDGEKIAVYKDKDGLITALNPTCTHAGCIVGFNQVEKSWDCPCHGGRFDLDGRVLCGPPLANLATVTIED